MAEKEEPKTHSKKKLLLMILFALLLLGGGAAGGYFFFMHKLAEQGAGEHGKHDDTSAEETKHAEEAAETAKHEEVVEPDVYYPVPAPFLVNYPPGSSAKVIKISITLLVQGESSVAALKKHDPMIRSNLLMAISSVGADKAKTSEGKNELRALLLAETGKVLEKMAGKNTVKELYFTEFVMQ